MKSKLNSARQSFTWKALLFRVILKIFTEFCSFMFTSLIQMFKSSGMVFFVFNTNTVWNFFGFTIILLSLTQFMVVWDSSISVSIRETILMNLLIIYFYLHSYEAIICLWTRKKLFLEISQNSLAQVFSCEFAKFRRTPFLTEHLRWLLQGISI